MSARSRANSEVLVLLGIGLDDQKLPADSDAMGEVKLIERAAVATVYVLLLKPLPTIGIEKSVVLVAVTTFNGGVTSFSHIDIEVARAPPRLVILLVLCRAVNDRFFEPIPAQIRV